MSKNYIGLKFGNIKCWHFEENFCKDNKSLVDNLNNLYDEMYSGCLCVFHASEKNKGNIDIKTRLCDLLDKFFDLGVEIYNDFDNKRYKTKKSYRKYLLTYGEE